MKFCPWHTAPPSSWNSDNNNAVKIYHDFLSGEMAAKISVKPAELELLKKALQFQKDQKVNYEHCSLSVLFSVFSHYGLTAHNSKSIDFINRWTLHPMKATRRSLP